MGSAPGLDLYLDSDSAALFPRRLGLAMGLGLGFPGLGAFGLSLLGLELRSLLADL